MEAPLSEVQSIFDRLSEEGGIPGGYILISEVLKGNELQLSIHISQGVTPWTAIGMLSEAMAFVPVDDLVDVNFEGDEDWYEDEDEEFPPLGPTLL